MKIALTGIIAGGKSTVATYLSERFPVLDADEVNANLLECQEIQEEIMTKVLDSNKAFDKKLLAQEVFESECKRKKLEAILHPRIKEAILKWFEEHVGQVVFVEVPILYESGFDNLFDKVCVVYVSEEEAIDRLCNQRGYTEREARKRISSQMPIEEKVRRADYLIHNNTSQEALLEKVDQMILEIEEDLCNF